MTSQPDHRGPVDNTSTHGAFFWIALAIGCASMGWGIVVYLDAVPAFAARLSFGTWLVGADLAHDLLVAPIALAIGWAVSRLVPSGIRPPVQAALFASAIVLVLAWLPLHRTGAAARNSTIQPLDYTTSTLTALTLVWCVAGLWAVARHRRNPRSSRS